MRSNQTPSVIGVLAISFGLPAIAPAEGDAPAGKTLSANCQACHVGDNIGDTPRLAGQRPTYIAKQLKAFKAGDRKNPVMNAMTSVLDDAAIDNLAAFWSSQPSGSDTTVPPEIAAVRKGKMTFPRDFPKGFVLYSTTNKEDQPVVSKSYVNAAGLAAVKAGKPLPDGTVIIVVNSAAKIDASKKPIVEKDGSWAIDKVVAYAGMEARTGWGNAIPELLRNANWNYAVFNPDKTPKAEINQAVCLACHKPQVATSYLFLLKDIQAKASAK
jgi:cytochrome c553